MWKDNISKNNFEQCLKCDICSTVCPMLEVNPDYPGPKQAGPDGERYRLKDPAFYDLTLRYCLDCKRCEVACPSGVRVGDIIQSARIAYGRHSHPLRNKLMAGTDIVGSLAAPVSPIVNSLLKVGPVRSALGAMGIDRRRTLPKYNHETFAAWFQNYEQGIDTGRTVSYYHGCYVNYNYPELGMALIKLVNACGWRVRLMESERCCGAALISNGYASMATRNARTNISAIRKAVKTGADAVISTSPTCTYTIRDEYDNILGVETGDARGALMLATKWLYKKIEEGSVKLAFKPAEPRTIAYHTSCHMRKLGWAIYSVGLLRMIPEMRVEVLEQECCGLAGTFGFKKENYEFSQAIGSKLFGLIGESGAELVATDCESCRWQIEMSTGRRVLHPVEILAEALDLEKTFQLNNGNVVR